MNVPVRLYSLPPTAASLDLAKEFGCDLYVARIDPSDPDDCFRFLADLYPDRLREVLANAERATYEAGQLYIEAEVQRGPCLWMKNRAECLEKNCTRTCSDEEREQAMKWLTQDN